MNDNQFTDADKKVITDNRPRVIRADEWGLVAAAVDAGQAVVWEDNGEDSFFREMAVLDVKHDTVHEGKYHVKFEGFTCVNVEPDREYNVRWLPAAVPPTAPAGSAEAQTFAKLCEREIVKIRTLTLKDDEYTGDLLGDAVGSPVGVTLCVEARMRQISDLQAEVNRLKKQISKLKHTADLDEGFIEYLKTDREEE